MRSPPFFEFHHVVLGLEGQVNFFLSEAGSRQFLLQELEPFKPFLGSFRTFGLEGFDKLMSLKSN